MKAKKLFASVLFSVAALFAFVACSTEVSESGSTTEYTITFDANGGSGKMKTLSGKPGSTVKLPECTFARENFEFDGWAEKADGDAVYKNGQSITMKDSDFTLYALWKSLPPTAQMIRLKSLPEKTEYTLGEEFDVTGMVVELVYSDGNFETVEGWTTDFAQVATKPGMQNVTVSYGKMTATFCITVKEINISGIRLLSLPQKTVYFVGEEFDSTGMTVAADFESGESKVVTGWTTDFAQQVMQSGSRTVTVTFAERTASFEITVTEIALTGIELVSLPAKRDYILGQTFETEGISVKAHYNNGHEEIVSGWICDGVQVIAEAGQNKTVTVTYEGKTATFTVNVDGIVPIQLRIKSLPAKTEYEIGDDPDLTGLSLEALYNDGTLKEVTGWTSDFDIALQSTGTKTVTLRWNGLTASFTVTVGGTEVDFIQIRSQPVKKSYFVGDQFDPTGMKVLAVFKDETSREVTNWTTNFDTQTKSSGTKTITVTFGGKSATFTVNVTAVVVSSIEIVSQPSKTEYIVGDSFESTGLEVVAHYNNGTSKTVTDWTTNGTTVVRTAGEDKTVTVSYSGKSATFKITVVPVSVASIKVIVPPVKTTYYQFSKDSDFDKSGMEVKATYNNGTTAYITGYTTNLEEASKTAGDNVLLTVTYQGQSATMPVEIIALESIEVTAKPAKLNYYDDETLDCKGMTVTKIYSDGVRFTVTDWTADADLTVPGTRTVTVSYGGKTATFTVEVVGIESIQISTVPSKNLYLIGEEFDTTCLTVLGRRTDGSSINITDYEIAGFDSSAIKLGQTLTVSYNNGIKLLTTTYTVDIADNFQETVELLPAGTDGSLGTQGTYCLFGDYPQTLKQSSVTVVENKKIANGAGQYYYLGSDGYWYAKQDEKPYASTYKYWDGTSVGTGTKYFKVEPVKWRILTYNYQMPGNVLLFAENALLGDVKYNDSLDDREIAGETVHATNYRYSLARAFLNGKYESLDNRVKDYEEKGFLQNCFTPVAQSFIEETDVVNSLDYTTDYSRRAPFAKGYDCENTQDKIFYLSMYEVSFPEYGFADYQEVDEVRKISATDFAIATGREISGTGKITKWWTRTPGYYSGSGSRAILNDGAMNAVKVNLSPAIVPALTLKPGTIETPDLVSIRVETPPLKTECAAGEAFDRTGMVVKGTYSDGKEEEIIYYSTDFDQVVKTVGSNKTVTVSYGGKTATFTIEVINLFYSQLVMLPSGTNGSVGTSGTYCYFGAFPRTVKAGSVTVNESQSITMGANTYYTGSDGFWYAKAKEYAYGTDSQYKYTDGTQAKQSSASSYRYFKVEPIKWCVVTQNYNNTGKALLLAEEVLTANVPYFGSYSPRTRTVGSDSEIYPNNYKYSQIRAYLNGLDYYYYDTSSTKTIKKTDYTGMGFLQTAFTSSAQGLIAETTVDNSGASTTDYTGSLPKADGTHRFSDGTYDRDYTCADTSDRIFLLSEYEVTNTTWGFAKYSVYGTGNSRIRMPTDYALANYAYKSSSAGFGDNWWLRSPRYSYLARYVYDDGNADWGATVSGYTEFGVVPALCVDASLIQQ